MQVRNGSNLSQLKVLRAKLANEGSTIDPDIAEGGVIDASHPVAVKVYVFGHRQDWTIYAETVEETVRTVSVQVHKTAHNTVCRATASGLTYRLKT